jgi:two-component system, sensor histidine kinase and response regulator
MNITEQLQIITIFLPITLLVVVNSTEYIDTSSDLDGAVAIEEEIADDYKLGEYFERIDNLISQNKFAEALQLAEEAELIAENTGLTDWLVKSALYQGDILLTQGHYARSIEILSSAYGDYRESDDGLRIGNLLATAYRFNNELNRSLSLYLEVLERVRSENDPVLEAGVEQNLAVVYEMLGEIDEAIERYFNSLEIGLERADTTLQIIVYNNIGDLYNKEGELDLAEKYLYESLDLAKQVNSYEDMKRAYLNLGVLNREKGNYNQALEYYQLSLEYSNRIGSITGPIQILYNIGNIHLDRERYELARESYLESLRQSEEINLQQGIYYNNLGLGDVLFKTGEYNSAIERYNRSLEIAENSGSMSMELNVLERLWTSNENLEMYEDAFTILKRHKSLSDSLQSRERDEAITRFETLYELQNERRQNDLLEEKLIAQRSAMLIGIISIVLLFGAALLLFRLYRSQRFTTDKLRLQHSELEELYKRLEMKKSELSNLNQTKDKLFSVLGHDLRAPITQLHALTLILRENKNSELDLDQVLNKVDDKLRYSISTLENYLNWAQSQMNGLKPELKPVHLRELADDVVIMMKTDARKKKIDIHNLIDDSFHVQADQSLLLITLQNLISNAIKFSYPGDTVVLDASAANGKVSIAVRDKGIGIPDEIQGKLFGSFDESRKGTRNEKGTGLGLSICKEFSDKQGGRIWYESMEEQGTTFYLEFDAATNEVVEV